uniref:Uncharacterized protein n=1 Tax=Rhodopseudomonas palustris (strain DX-1) TaxID=652103 RepID=E6VL50_RHOPX
MRALKHYAYRVLVALDHLLNAVLGGYPDETVSYRSATARDEGKRWGCVLCKVLDAIDRDHCTKALVNTKLGMLIRGMH